MVEEALKAADILEKQGIKAAVLGNMTIVPLDERIQQKSMQRR